jgi:hypothetical protein
MLKWLKTHHILFKEVIAKKDLMNLANSAYKYFNL